MECLVTTKNLKINKNKQIGDVVIIVEGEGEEPFLLKHIFTKVLNYNYVSAKRGKKDLDTYIDPKNDKYIYVITLENSNITSIKDPKEYVDNLYNIIKNKLNRSVKNARIYIIWDRDNKSNPKKLYQELLKIYGNSQDNGFEMNGLLLVSYPCVETYEISNFDRNLYKKSFETSKEVKDVKNLNKIYSIKNINEDTLKYAVINMHKIFTNLGYKSYDPSNFKSKNIKIFEYEESEYKENKTYIALSLISIMFIDLGIIYDNREEKGMQ